MLTLSPKPLAYVNVYGTDSSDVLYASPYGIDTHIDAGGGADIVYGGNGNDTVWGGAGDDQVYGGAGNDTLYGGDNNDTLNGGIGNDTLFGDNGNDTIVGGAGIDVMYGGTGWDTFVFNSASEAPVPPPDAFGLFNWDLSKFDTIADFNPGEGDRIDLRGIVNEAGGMNNITLFADKPGAQNSVGHDLVIEVWHKDSQQPVAMIHAHSVDAIDFNTAPIMSWLIL